MLIGIALDNVDNPPQESLDRVAALHAQVVGTLWTPHPRDGGGTAHRRSVYDQLEARLDSLDSPTYVIRVGPSARITAPQWREQAERALDELPPDARRRVYVRLLNEVNLPAEGDWPAREYAAWLVEALSLLRSVDPNVRTLTAPLSLGVYGYPDYWDDFVDACIAMTGSPIPTTGISVNAYAHLFDASDTFLRAAVDYDVEIHMTELNTLDPGPGPERVSWLTERLADLEDRGYDSAQLFIAGGQSHGAWDERYILRDDEAESLGLWSTARQPSPLAALVEDIIATEPLPVEVTLPPPLALPVPSLPAPPTESHARAAIDALPSGRGLWVWYAPAVGGADGIIAAAQAAHASHVLVKGGDGRDFWPQLTHNNLVARLRDAGLFVLGWQYCYGENAEQEVEVARRILDSGVHGIVADVEAEYEGRWREAEHFAASVRQMAGDRLFGYSPLPVIDLHRELPYVQFNRHCDVVLPQFYSRALGADRWPLDRLYTIWHTWRATWTSWNLPVPPLAPVGEMFAGATPEDVYEFEFAAREHGVRSWSFWELGQAKPEHLAALSQPPASAPAQLTPASLAEITSGLDGIWHQTIQLDSLQHTTTAVEIQRHVARVKVALGLQHSA